MSSKGKSGQKNDIRDWCHPTLSDCCNSGGTRILSRHYSGSTMRRYGAYGCSTEEDPKVLGYTMPFVSTCECVVTVLAPLQLFIWLLCTQKVFRSHSVHQKVFRRYGFACDHVAPVKQNAHILCTQKVFRRYGFACGQSGWNFE